MGFDPAGDTSPPERPNWVTMTWPEHPRVAWGTDGSALLAFRRTKSMVAEWRALQAGDRVWTRWDGLLKHWRVVPRSQLGRLELNWLIQAQAFRAWPTEDLLQVLEWPRDSVNGLAFAEDTYYIPREIAVEHSTTWRALLNEMGDHAHGEWRAAGLQIMTRRNTCHVLLRTAVHELQIPVRGGALAGFEPAGMTLRTLPAGTAREADADSEEWVPR